MNLVVMKYIGLRFASELSYLINLLLLSMSSDSLLRNNFTVLHGIVIVFLKSFMMNERRSTSCLLDLNLQKQSPKVVL